MLTETSRNDGLSDSDPHLFGEKARHSRPNNCRGASTSGRLDRIGISLRASNALVRTSSTAWKDARHKSQSAVDLRCTTFVLQSGLVM